ncbi:SDR family oxidoreductase (plasmid) [Cereibacter azotoformans]|uniref:SDR family oxidoreductase n=1 Tax=Cereibacter azotoformans TaxID=43057 RepID=UPI000E35C282|nr:SDR family oxidoreductase [Cereibacter azotoformans]AXQ95945.1 SDR family oxidoreductase [Cereibacter sphaeroides]UIJ33014.1 SDR family oxidoreductase [Cereibacter azotoformans]
MTKDPVLILGAGSDIARAIARRLAADGHPLQLAARDAARLEADRRDLELRHAVAVTLHEFDACDIAAIPAFLDGLPALPGIAVSAVGLLGAQAASERDPAAALAVLRTNFEGPAMVFAELANRMEAQGRGTLVGISSVAGDRGRATNYIYGAAKAGYTAFLSGLRNRLARKGVQVITVLPGFVATRMTEGMNLPARLTARPEEVAEAVARAIGRRQDVIYVRPVWRLIMAIIRALPEALFKRLKL